MKKMLSDTLENKPQDEFEDSIQKTYQAGFFLIQKKNADYANPSDPFKNFRSAGVLGLSVEKAILVRTLDKLSRVSSLLERPPQVVEESLEDTLLDAINYLAILKAYREMNVKTTPLKAYREVSDTSANIGDPKMSF